MLLGDVPSLLYAAARLGPWVIISLHAFLHAIIDQSCSVWCAQLSSLSFNSIHFMFHTQRHQILYHVLRCSHPFKPLPCDACLLEGGVLHPFWACRPSPSRSNRCYVSIKQASRSHLTPRSLGNTTTTTSTSSGPLQPHRSPPRHRLLKSSPLPPIQSTPVELNHPTPLP
jgi:hypothetical protein